MDRRLYLSRNWAVVTTENDGRQECIEHMSQGEATQYAAAMRELGFEATAIPSSNLDGDTVASTASRSAHICVTSAFWCPR